MSKLKLNRPRTLWIKTILIFLTGGIFICVLFSILYYRTVKIMTEKTNLLFENTVYQVSERCSQETGQMEDLILGISENQWVKNYLSGLLSGTDNFSMTEVRIVREALRERNLSMAENVYVYTKDYEPINCFTGMRFLTLRSHIKHIWRNTRSCQMEIYSGDIRRGNRV